MEDISTSNDSEESSSSPCTKDACGGVTLGSFVAHQYFDYFIVLIVLFCSALSVSGDYTQVDSDGNLLPTTTVNILIQEMEIVFVSIFTIEAILKLMAYGLVTEDNYFGTFLKRIDKCSGTTTVSNLGYFSDYWNLLDFIIVITSWISIYSSYKSVQFLRAFRALRPLKAAANLPVLRDTIESLLNSLSDLGDVSIVFLFVILLFTIIGLQSFRGPFFYSVCRLTPFPVNSSWTEGADPYSYRCIDASNFALAEDSNIPKEESPWFESQLDCFWPIDKVDPPSRLCSLYDTGPSVCYHDMSIPETSWRYCGSDYDGFGNYRYANYAYYKQVTYTKDFDWGFTSFNDFLESLLIVIMCATGANFSTFIFRSMDSISVATCVYYFFLVYFVSFFVLQLILVTLIENYKKVKYENENIDSITRNASRQLDVSGMKVVGVTVRTSMVPMKIARIIDRESTRCAEFITYFYTMSAEVFEPVQHALKPLVDHWIYEATVNVLIIANTIVLSMDHYPMEEQFGMRLDAINFILTLAFVVDMVLKMLALGLPVYCWDSSNMADAIIVLASLSEAILNPPRLLFPPATSNAGAASSGAANALRSLRLLKLFRLCTIESVSTLIRQMITCVVAMQSYLILLFLFHFIFILVGLQFFSNRFRFDSNGLVINHIGSLEWQNPANWPRHNFDDFPHALASVFQLFTLDNWTNIAWSTRKLYGGFGILYPITIVLIGSFVLLNLFLSIMLEIFCSFKIRTEEELSQEAEDIEDIVLNDVSIDLGDPNNDNMNHCRRTSILVVEKIVTKNFPCVLASISLDSWTTEDRTKGTNEDLYENSMSLDLQHDTPGAVNRELPQLMKVDVSELDNDQLQLSKTESVDENCSHESIVLLRKDDDCSIEDARNEPMEHVSIDIKVVEEEEKILMSSRSSSDAIPKQSHKMLRQDDPFSIQDIKIDTRTDVLPYSQLHINEYPTHNEKNVGPPKSRWMTAALSAQSVPQSPQRVEEFLRSTSINVITSSKRREDEEKRIRREIQDIKEKFHNSFYLWTRRQCRNLLDNTLFELLTISVVLASSLLLSFQSPLNDPTSFQVRMCQNVELFFTSFFLFEISLRIYAYKVIPFFRSTFNTLDFCVVLFGYVLPLVSEKLFICFRALRPLYVLRTCPGVGKIVLATISCIPRMLAVSSVLIVLYFSIALFFVGFLKGQLRACSLTSYAPIGSNTSTLEHTEYFTYSDDNNVQIPGNPYYRLLVNPKPWDLLSFEEKSWFGNSTQESLSPHTFTCTSWPEKACCPQLGDLVSSIAPTSRHVCECWGGTWERVVQKQFDNVGQAMISMYMIGTLDAWTNVMYAATDSRGIDMEPIRNYSQYWIFIFILVVIVENLLGLNFFVGAMFSFYCNYREPLEEEANEDDKYFDLSKSKSTPASSTSNFAAAAVAAVAATAFAIATAAVETFINAITVATTTTYVANNTNSLDLEWEKVKDIVLQTKPMTKENFPTSECRKACHKIIKTKIYSIFINMCIVSQFVVLGLPSFGMRTDASDALVIVNNVLAIVFLLEAVLKILGMGVTNYFKIMWNRIDFAIVVGMIIQYSMIYAEIETSYLANVARLLRMSKVLTLASKSKSILRLISSLYYMIPKFGNIVLLLLLVVYSFSILGMFLFAKNAYGDTLTPQANFRTFVNSFILMLRMVCGEGWSDLTYELSRSPDGCIRDQEYDPQYCGFSDHPGCLELNGCGQKAAFAYLTLFYFIIGIIYINMFMNVVLTYFNELYTAHFKSEDFVHFSKYWTVFHEMRYTNLDEMRYTNLDKMFLHVDDLTDFIAILPKPLGYGSDVEKIFVSLVDTMKSQESKNPDDKEETSMRGLAASVLGCGQSMHSFIKSQLETSENFFVSTNNAQFSKPGSSIKNGKPLHSKKSLLRRIGDIPVCALNEEEERKANYHYVHFSDVLMFLCRALYQRVAFARQEPDCKLYIEPRITKSKAFSLKVRKLFGMNRQIQHKRYFKDKDSNMYMPVVTVGNVHMVKNIQLAFKRKHLKCKSDKISATPNPNPNSPPEPLQLLPVINQSQMHGEDYETSSNEVRTTSVGGTNSIPLTLFWNHECAETITTIDSVNNIANNEDKFVGYNAPIDTLNDTLSNTDKKPEKDDVNDTANDAVNDTATILEKTSKTDVGVIHPNVTIRQRITVLLSTPITPLQEQAEDIYTESILEKDVANDSVIGFGASTDNISAKDAANDSVIGFGANTDNVSEKDAAND